MRTSRPPAWPASSRCASARRSRRLPLLDGPFDLIFLDADKAESAEYLECVLGLARQGTLIVADNVVRGGGVAEPDSSDPRVRGVRRFFDLVAADARVEATAIQTVGGKGWDGFTLALVTAAPT